MLCGTSSRLVQVTVDPIGTDIAAGAKLKLSTTISFGAVAGFASSSGTSVIAIGWSTAWNDSCESPSSLRRRSSSTFIGPGDGAVPGAGCGNAVDIAV